MPVAKASLLLPAGCYLWLDTQAHPIVPSWGGCEVARLPANPLSIVLQYITSSLLGTWTGGNLVEEITRQTKRYQSDGGMTIKRYAMEEIGTSSSGVGARHHLP